MGVEFWCDATMRTGSDYDRAITLVRQVIHEWDPYSLLRSGAPMDEWDHEIASIVAQIPRIASERDAMHAVSRVFSSAFQPEGFGVEDCADVGRRLFAALTESGILV
jgi:hypothetical protein